MLTFLTSKPRRNRSGFTLIELLVVIAIIGILASIVLASLNSARRKSRDARRVADIKQLQIALDLYFDSQSPNAYPASGSLGVLDDVNSCGTGNTCIPTVPSDPLGTAYSYRYCRLTTTSYHLGTSLEDNTSPALNTDRDLVTATCTGGDAITGTDTGKCVTADPGSYCYDITP